MYDAPVKEQLFQARSLVSELMSPLTVEPMEGVGGDQDVDEKMDEELPLEERSAHSASHAERLIKFTDSQRESGGRTADGARRLPVRLEKDEHGDQPRTGRHSWTDGHHLHGNLLRKGRSRFPHGIRAVSILCQSGRWCCLC